MNTKKMGQYVVVVNDDLDKRFRDAVYKVKGMKRGNIKEAFEEAMELWIQSAGSSAKKK
jgi:hypothetical protein